MFGWEESGDKGSRWNESEEKSRDILFFDWLDRKKREKGFWWEALSIDQIGPEGREEMGLKLKILKHPNNFFDN